MDQRALAGEQIRSTLVQLRIDTVALKLRLTGGRLVIGGTLKKMRPKSGELANDKKLMGQVEMQLKRIKGVSRVEFQLDDQIKK